MNNSAYTTAEVNLERGKINLAVIKDSRDLTYISIYRKIITCVYNSIIHKHIQFIPSHIDSGDDILPIYSLLKEKHNLFSHAGTPVIRVCRQTCLTLISYPEHKGIFKCKKLPFIHYFSYIPDLRSCNTEGETCSAVKECLERYKCAINACLNDAGLADESSTNISDDGIILDSEGKSFSHNFLLTSNWLLVVTRKVSEVRSLGFNSIAFTGEILVKNQEQLEIVRDLGPLNLLSSACYPQKNSLDSKSKLEAGGSIS